MAAVNASKRRESAVSVVVVIVLAPSGASVADAIIAQILISLWCFYSSFAVKRACVTYIRLADLQLLNFTESSSASSFVQVAVQVQSLERGMSVGSCKPVSLMF